MKKPIQIFTIIFFVAVNFFAAGTNTASAQASDTGILPEDLKIITGTVLDEQGYPIPGISVCIDGDSRPGVLTDFDGNFTIETKRQTLIFTCVGFITEKKVLDAQSNNIYIVLKEEIQYLPIDYLNMGYRDFNTMKMLESTAATTKSLTIKKRRTFFGRIFHSIGNIFR